MRIRAPSFLAVMLFATSAASASETTYSIFGTLDFNQSYIGYVKGSFDYDFLQDRSVDHKASNVSIDVKARLRSYPNQGNEDTFLTNGIVSDKSVNIFTSDRNPVLSINYNIEPTSQPFASKSNNQVGGDLYNGYYNHNLNSLIVYQGTQQDLFAAVILNSVKPKSTGINMFAGFTPNFGLSLQDAAVLGGFTGFNWVQTVNHLPSPSPFYANSNPSVPLTSPPAFSDPPQGGYTYQPGPTDQYPFYRDSAENARETIGNTLLFEDLPADPCLFGGQGSACGGLRAAKGDYLEFSTDLVGVLPGNKVGPRLAEFTWISTFNGTTKGGTAQLYGDQPLDPDSGYGGTTLLSEEYFLGNGVSQVPLPNSVLLFGAALALLGCLSIRMSRFRCEN